MYIEYQQFPPIWHALDGTNPEYLAMAKFLGPGLHSTSQSCSNLRNLRHAKFRFSIHISMIIENPYIYSCKNYAWLCKKQLFKNMLLPLCRCFKIGLIFSCTTQKRANSCTVCLQGDHFNFVNRISL